VKSLKCFLFGLFLVAVLTTAQEAAGQPPVTFTKDVAPILFAHCVTCHRPGDIAPFSLLTYQDARPWAAAIARITDQSLRYSVDKTTREVLFLPLPSELRQEIIERAAAR